MYKGMNFGGGMNMQSLMKQAQKMQAEMQQNMERAEEELENTTLTGTSGGGMVEVTCNGKKKIQSVTLKPEIVDPDDIEMLEDLIVAAVNEAVNKADELEKSLKGDMPGGMGF
ncbi:MAG: YbaB/EbfC family nucleoid-associated protein [Clostridiales bacterium]|nr:YbaB/EbfC family nucleoid-associated protein [Clostridiales bacterium]